ncbi:MAG TPA: AAA family ATPase [Candidatus Bathyarchaeia archaeon]|nr:AAA family ATPase [Candidatus Bathyarchaeia archaeon]
MKIAVAGKGGVGKTLIAGVLAEFFARKGFTVLAIDADPTPNLALTLGLSVEEASKIVPISENTPLIESKTQSSIPGVYNLAFSVDDIVEQFSVKTPYNVNLLIMGTVKSAGAGCMCPANTVIRALLHHLIVKRKEAVVTDMEAGLEHMGRGTAEHVETMLTVTDSSRKSLETAKKLFDLAKQVGIKECFIVGNKVTNQPEGEHIENFARSSGMQTLGLVPFDVTVLKADMQGQTPLKYADESMAVATIREIGTKLL